MFLNGNKFLTWALPVVLNDHIEKISIKIDNCVVVFLFSGNQLVLRRRTFL